MKFAIVASILAIGASAVEMKACSGTNMGGRCTAKVSDMSISPAEDDDPTDNYIDKLVITPLAFCLLLPLPEINMANNV